MSCEKDRPSLLEVSFDPPSSGCLFFKVSPLTGDGQVSATHIDDPFPGMIEWLDEIVRGARIARWTIEEEGTTAQFVFLGTVPSLSGPVAPQLVFLRGNETGEVFALSSCASTPLDVARAFYVPFRTYVRSTSYDPGEWEMMGDPEEWPWQGDKLRALRSALIEEALSGPGEEQMGLPLRYPWS